MERRCFFIGHRETAGEVYPYLYAAVLQHVKEYGVKEFIVGRYGNFDRMAAEAVMQAKKTATGYQTCPFAALSSC